MSQGFGMSPSVKISIVGREKNSLRKMYQGFVMLPSVDMSFVDREKSSFRKMSQGFGMSPSVEISIVGREKKQFTKNVSRFCDVTKCRNINCWSRKISSRKMYQVS